MDHGGDQGLALDHRVEDDRQDVQADQNFQRLKTIAVDLGGEAAAVEIDQVGKGPGFQAVGIDREQAGDDNDQGGQEQGDDAERADRIMADMGLVALARQIAEDRLRPAQKAAKARRRAAEQAPPQAKHQKPGDAGTGYLVPGQVVAFGAPPGEHDQAGQQPVKQPGREVPYVDAGLTGHSLVIFLAIGRVASLASLAEIAGRCLDRVDIAALRRGVQGVGGRGQGVGVLLEA